MTEEEAKQRAKEIIALWRDGLSVVLSQLATADAENARMRAALAEYADRANWLVNRECSCHAEDWIWLGSDGAKLAQTTLDACNKSDGGTNGT